MFLQAESPCVSPLQNIYCDCAEEIRSTLEHSLIIFPGNTSEECGVLGAIVQAGDTGRCGEHNKSSPATATCVMDNPAKAV